MALHKIKNPMRDDMYFSPKTGKYKVDLSRFGISKKAEESPTPAMKSARRKSIKLDVLKNKMKK